VKKKIPKNWKLWIKLAQGDYVEMVSIIREEPEEDRKLIALCLSAAKWFTGDCEDFGIGRHTACGICAYNNLADAYVECEECIIGCQYSDPEGECWKGGADGTVMKMYAEEFAKRRNPK